MQRTSVAAFRATSAYLHDLVLRRPARDAPCILRPSVQRFSRDVKSHPAGLEVQVVQAFEVSWCGPVLMSNAGQAA